MYAPMLVLGKGQGISMMGCPQEREIRKMTNKSIKNESANQTESLTTEESSRLGQLEETIENTMQSSSKAIGPALKEIRDSRLYRAEYRTFEEYVRVRWSYSKSHAYRLIDFAKATADEGASPNGDTPKWKNESSYRKSKTGARAKPAKSAKPDVDALASPVLELKRKTVVSLDEEFASFTRYLSRLDIGLCRDECLQLLARMRDELNRIYEAKAQNAEVLTQSEIPELEEVAA